MLRLARRTVTDQYCFVIQPLLIATEPLRANSAVHPAFHSCAAPASSPTESSEQEPGSTRALNEQNTLDGIAEQTPVEKQRPGNRGSENRRGQAPQIWAASLAHVSRQLTRQDIVDFFNECNLSVNEVRAQYSDTLEVEKYWMNFSSKQGREGALNRTAAYLGARKAGVRPGSADDFKQGIYNPMAMSSRGRYVRVSNLAESVTSDDVLRFFHGFNLHAKSVTFLRQSQGEKGTLGVAVVRFHSQEEAHRAVRTRQGSFCVNSQVQLNVLL